ncbi:DUF6493 family protein [Pedobacter sp. JY14-1]|uniref:DUF6493 family protein n=1 Tax=Pedobacter sp. JY14-1 TaxID=3034151 RepID=UPI0023E181B0|nr:DUF6493 family protein [Pedobacter sp. JY14-1]
MGIIEEFTSIVEKKKDVMPFLKKLDKGQKKELYPALKKLDKYYSEFVQQGNGSYSSRGTESQYRILGLAEFICFNQKDFEQSTALRVVNRENLTDILPWYCPDWFNDYVDKLALKEFVPFDYDWYMDLIEQGYLQANQLMIAKILPAFIFPRQEKTWKFEYKPENLLKRAVTLQEHIWYLFEFESNLHAAEGYKKFEDDSAPGRWMYTLKRYADEGKISRERLLKESISAATKNFNQSASNWFMDLFMFLEPTKAELLYFQNDLLNTFNSANSKPYNVVLKLFKELVTDSGFVVAPFLDHVSLVLTAESKTAVSSALMLLDKLAKIYTGQREQICILSCQAFIHQDNNLQLRAAKLIKKYGVPDSGDIKEAIQSYYDALFSEAKNLLSDFSAGFDNRVVLTDDVLADSSSDLVEICLPENFDEFVFLASQSFDQNQTYHFDLLPAAMLKFQNEMTADNILKLMPAFQRAYKMITNDWTISMGYLDSMLAKFFISYGQLLVSFNPIAAEPIRIMQQSFVKLEEERKAKWDGYKIRLSGIKTWDVYTRSKGYKPHKHILLSAFSLLERKISLPLLSTPTHAPCWVSIIVLIERLSLYQRADVMPDDMDLQIAVVRCHAGNVPAAISAANENLKGEYRDLVRFILGEDYRPQKNSRMKNAWLVAGNIKSDLSCEFAWNSLVEDYVFQEYDYKVRKYFDVPAKRKVIRINFSDKQKKASAFKTILSKVLRSVEEVEPSVYDCTELKFDYISAEHNDIKRLFYLNPRQPDILIAHIIHKGLRYVDFSSENDKKLIIYTLEALLTLNYHPGTMSDLLIASCMISSDRTVRTYAAELWIKGITEENLDSSTIGKIVGKHESIELAPLKRFTDLVISNMFQISQKHNRALENLLTSCIAEMNDTTINGCKKLLEIYAEVLSINNSKVEDDRVIRKLNTWGTAEALKKVIKRITG